MTIMNRMHPFTVFFYFLIIIGITAFILHPVMLGISFIGVVLFAVILEERITYKQAIWYLVAFVVLSCINPLFYHNGVTVLFVLNGNPITLEAILYGMVASGTILTVLLWCKLLTRYMTTDKTLYLIGGISKKGALIVSMVFRLSPQYRYQAEQIKETQKALGLFDGGSLWDTIKGHLHVFSAMMTWAMEHSVDTADSMKARGYGMTKRSNYIHYRMHNRDILCLCLMVCLLAIAITGIIDKGLTITYYPEFVLKNTSVKTLGIYFAFGFLVLLLPLYECKEKLKWKYLK